jgi:hypothetical protein
VPIGSRVMTPIKDKPISNQELVLSKLSLHRRSGLRPRREKSTSQASRLGCGPTALYPFGLLYKRKRNVSAARPEEDE